MSSIAAEVSQSETSINFEEVARRILTSEDPINYVLNVANTLHIGDRNALLQTYCCVLSTKIANSEGLHPKLTGDSGKGKSDLADTVEHTVHKDKIWHGTASPKALHYHEIPPGTVIYFDDYKQNDDMDSVIKQSTSNFHAPLAHRTVQNGKPFTVEMPSEIVYFITSVNSDQDIQVLNRALMLEVDDSTDQDLKVAERYLQKAAIGEVKRPVTEEVLICREIFRTLDDTDLLAVKIPFAERIEWNDPSNRRNLPMFIDVVRSITFWRRFQRDIDADGSIIATEDDFELARDVFVPDGDNGGFNVNRLTDKGRELARLIIENGGKMKFEDARRALKISKGRLSQLKREISQLPDYTEEKIGEIDYKAELSTCNDNYKTTKRTSKTILVMQLDYLTEADRDIVILKPIGSEAV